jgi:hypothetical protein
MDSVNWLGCMGVGNQHQDGFSRFQLGCGMQEHPGSCCCELGWGFMYLFECIGVRNQ